MLQFYIYRRVLTELVKSASLNGCRACGNIQYVSRRTFITRKSTGQPKEQKKEKRKQERKEIVGELKKGYFGDLKEFGASGGKRFFAMDKLMDEKDAVIFPELQAKSLKKKYIKLNEQFPNNMTLVLMWFRAIGQNMCEMYRQPFLNEFQAQADVNCYEVSVVDGWFFKLMKPFIERNLRKQISLQKQDNYLCYFGKTEPIRKALIENIIVGHAFLVDSSGRVRWKAHGKPTPEELKYMMECSHSLLKDTRKRTGKSLHR